METIAVTSNRQPAAADSPSDPRRDAADPLSAPLLALAQNDDLSQKLYLGRQAHEQPRQGASQTAPSAGHEPIARELTEVWQKLRRSEPLVTTAAIEDLTRSLAALADNGGQILQLGDCVEVFAECHPEGYRTRLEFIDSVRRYMTYSLGAPVVAIGRIAGQFAKPRSQFYEACADHEGMLSFMGEMINSPRRDPWSRKALPSRLLWAQQAARIGTETLAEWNAHHPPIYCSHEALSLFYDGAQTFAEPGAGELSAVSYNRSCHLPWIGKRTTFAGSRHIRYLRHVGNPVAAKIGPETTRDTIDELIAAGNPKGVAGKLIFISRVGAGKAEACLGPLIERVQDLGAQVLWIIDPMHGNTQKNSHGMKYRTVADIKAEISEVLAVHRKLGSINSGLHLETSAAPIFECCEGQSECDQIVPGPRYQSLCDPRLDYEQTVKVVHHYLSQLRRS